MRAQLVACGLALSFACQPPQPKRDITVSLSAEHFSGSNGVRVFTIPDLSAEFVTVHVRYKTGSIDDPIGKEGLAHLVEHLMFTRTVELKGRTLTIGSRLDEVALANNAETRPDITHYWTVVPITHLSEMFAIETVRMTSGCQGITEDTFRREKEVVRNEIRERLSGDMGKIYPVLLKTFYGEHPYARPVGGTDASLRAITLADVCDFVAKNYAPSKATFYIVGNVTNDDVRRAAVGWLGRIPPREVPPPKTIPPAKMATGTREVTLDVEAPHLLGAWRLPVESKEYPLIGSAMSYLEGRMAFFSFTYDIGTSVWTDTYGGARAPIAVLGVELAGLSKKGEAIDAMEKSGDSIEFDMPRGPIRMYDVHSSSTENLLARFEAPTTRGMAFADLDDLSGGTRFLVEEVAAIHKISHKKLRSAASKTFDSDRAAFLYIKPSGKVTAGGGSGQSVNHESNQWRVTVNPEDAKSPLQLPYLATLNPVIADYKLDSGMRVILAKTGDLPITRAHLTFAVGSVNDPEELPGLASFAGTSQSGSVSEDFTRYGRRSLKTRIDYLISAISSYRRGTYFSQESVEKQRKNLRRRFSQPSVKARVGYLKRLTAALYGSEHPYAKRGHPAPESFRRIDQSDLRAFGNKYYGGASGTLIVAGQFKTELIKVYIDKHFDHWEKRSRPEPVPAVSPSHKVKPLVTAIDPTASLLSVELAFPGPKGVDELYPVRLVLAAIIGGRLRALREERGLTYGASASYRAARGPGRWQLGGEVDPSRAQEGVAAFVQTLRGLRSATAESIAADFVVARRAVVNQLLLSRTVSNATIGQLRFAAEHDLPLNYMSELPKVVAKVTPQQVLELIASELREDRQVIGLLGSSAAIQAGQLGTAPPRPEAVEPKPPAPTPAPAPAPSP